MAVSCTPCSCPVEGVMFCGNDEPFYSVSPVAKESVRRMYLEVTPTNEQLDGFTNLRRIFVDGKEIPLPGMPKDMTTVNPRRVSSTKESHKVFLCFIQLLNAV